MPSWLELYASFGAARYCVFIVFGQSSILVSKNRSTTEQIFRKCYMTEKNREIWDKYINYIQT
jgi:hypothetical protein